MRPALAAAAVGLLLLAGCGSEAGGGVASQGSGDLVWEKQPLLIIPATLPNDRVLYGTLRNDALRLVQTAASDVEVRDSSGRRVDASVAFTASFVHPINPPTREPLIFDEEQRRLGRRAKIEPGGSVPIVVSWRVKSGEDAPDRVVVDGGSLPIPAKTTQGS